MRESVVDRRGARRCRYRDTASLGGDGNVRLPVLPEDVGRLDEADVAGGRLSCRRAVLRQPAAGELVIFDTPKDEIYVKRVVGVPGDRIQMIGGALHINGAAVKRERSADFEDTDHDGKKSLVKRWRETLPNAATYEIIDTVENGPHDNTALVTVPPGQYFVLGDHRDNSVDSRHFGVIAAAKIHGRAILLWPRR